MITGIHFSSSKILLPRESNSQSLAGLFQKASVVSAKVVKLLGQGNALLEIEGRTITAKTDLLLKPGELLNLRVRETTDNIVLKLVEPDPKTTKKSLSSFLRSFAGKIDFSNTGTISSRPVLKQLLSDLALKSDKPDRLFLPRLIESSGLLMEKKIGDTILQQLPQGKTSSIMNSLLVQDLKAALLNDTLDMAGSPEGKSAVVSFAETIETFQQLNFSSQDSGRFLLPFPLLDDAVFKFGQLLIDTGKKDGSEKKDRENKIIQVSFLLEMSKLGPLRADFSILNKSIAGTFLLFDDQITAYVKSQVPELEKRLTSIGYKLSKVECLTASPKELSENSLIETLAKASDEHVLNVVV